jgi:hypothetical protein
MRRGRSGFDDAVAAEPSRVTETEPANWKPLEKRIGRRSPEFMRMFRQNGLDYYKHIDTRRYLILDQTGRCYCRSGGQLVRTRFHEQVRFVKKTS